MQNTEQAEISFEQIKELYKDMLKERAREKQRSWDREYKKKRYTDDPEFREKHKELVRLTREKKKLEKEIAAAAALQSI